MFVEGEEEHETDGSKMTALTDADDFFFAYATVEGHVAYRDVTEGTFFLQAVCDVWESYFDNTRLTDLMMAVYYLFSQKNGFICLEVRRKIKKIKHVQVTSDVLQITRPVLRGVYAPDNLIE